MRKIALLKRTTSSVAPKGRGRLSDFRFAGRLGPLLAFFAVCAALYAFAPAGALLMMIKLWVAYSVAFAALAGLARFVGVDAAWSWVLPIAVIGATLGGVASAAIVFAPNWTALLDPALVAREWMIGASFSAFFTGLSLVTAEVRRRDRLVADARQQLLEARLKTLTAQIEPHFLMNSLANLRYLIRTDAVAASRMLDHLADFLEGALERSRAPRSTLGQEFQLIDSYLSIMRIRLGERLRFFTEIPETLKEIPFPPLLLQTLVENAVTHGIEPQRGAGTIRVTARQDGGRILVSVTDDGVGVDHRRRSSQGLGLRNTRERLATFYRGRAALELAPASPSGTVAAISFPA